MQKDDAMDGIKIGYDETRADFENARDEKVESYNAISQFLISKGLNEEDLEECMKLVQDYSQKLVNYYSLLSS
jgi:hypothetical protein